MFILLGGVSFLSAQNTPPTSMADVDFSLVSWERGEVLVRFADHLSPILNTTKSRTKIGQVDAILVDYSQVRMEQLFPVQKPIPGGEKGFTTYTGKYYEYPKLTNIYKVSIKDTTYGAIFPLITALENLGDDYVIYAEPNYHFETDVTLPPTDALYQYQYNAANMNADSAWQIMNDSSITEEDIIIAIIDTGVDTAHVDLKDKKHINLIELNGQPGVDDDSNGYVDDISGWDFVNMDNGPIDDNSHGTHCAAIAVANHDTIGIAGIAPNAKYMPMKGLESSGGSSASALAQCATYAANNGADILSMSVGGYGRSLAFENALAYSYAFSIPVGAAGNDGICIRNDGQLCPDGRPPAPMFPGAYTFVLAAQATQQNPGWNGYRAWFTNYDFDGPTFTDYPDDFNYEVYAPGLGIISAIPGNQYATWNGTSMACPAVAGAVAIHRAFRPNRTKEQVFVDFIQSWYDMSKIFDKGQGYSTGFNSIDLVKALYPEEMPILWMNQFSVVDSSQGDGDSKADAGEHLKVRVDMKNVGTESDSVYVGIRMAEFEDKTIVHFIDSTAFLGSISSYATVSNNLDLFELQIDSGVVNGRNILFNIFSWTPGGDTTSQDYMIEAQSGCEYMGIYSGTTVWTPDCGIIVTANSAFDTLIIEPGTEIQIDPGVGIGYSHIIAEGKPDSMIVFTKNQNAFGTWNEIKNFGSDQAVFKYCIFEYGGRTGSIGGDDIIGPGNSTSFEDCVFRYCHAWYGIGWNILNPSDSSYIRRCNFVDNQSNLAVVNLDNPNWTGDFSNNNVSGNIYVQYYGEQPAVRFANQSIIDKISYNSFFKHGYQSYNNNRFSGYVLGVRDGNGGGHSFSTYINNYIDSNYYGTTNDQSINANIFDFEEFSSFPSVSGAEKKLTKPKMENHGHVWKILLDTAEVNIYNDPIHQIIGLGKHSVSVIFNRPMDVSETPFVTYGVRFPYTQNIVSDSAWWSVDSLTWNAFFDITQLTASDGYNKFGVRNISDNEGFDIPIEDYRFQFRVNVAGALSTGFTAVGDTSEIRLSWEAPDSIVDLIGYNILRVDTSQNNYDTSIINTALVLDTNYTDENVIGGNYYLYYYKPVRSSFTESQRSIGVWAAPYSSKPRVKTENAEEYSKGTITFNAKVDANFIATEARFLYGTSPNNLNAATAWENVGSNYYEVDYDRSISSVSAGTVYYYKVQAQNSLGIETGKVDSILTESIPSLTISGAIQICLGDSISLSVQSVTPDTTISLEWKYNGSVIGQGPSVKYLPNGQGTYSIELVAEGTYTTTTNETYDVSVVSGGSNNVAISYTGSTQLCQGQSLTLELPSSYTDILWNTGDTTSTITATQTGTYSATMKTSGAGCSFSSNTVNVVVSANPTATVSSTLGNTICDGSSADLTAPTGMSSYKWYQGGTQITGANSSTLSVTTAGNYQVEVTNSSGCSTLSTAYGMMVKTLPTGTISNASSLEFCEGDSVVLSGPSGMTYAWSTGATSSSITVSNTATVGLTITNSGGCSSALTSVDVIENQVPSLTVANGGALEFCFGGSVNLQASGGFSSYAWSNGIVSQSLIATVSGNYTVTGTTSDGCTITSAAQSVVVNANPVATVANSGSSVLCAGDSTTLSAPFGMSSYLWTSGDTTQTITASTAGNYTVTLTNVDGCSSTSAATSITITQITPPMITSNGSLKFCDGGSVSLAVPLGYNSFMWNNGSGFSQITATISGDYYALVMNADGCATSSDTVTVKVFATPPTPSISYTANDTLMTSSEPIGNQWYFNGNMIPGETGQTLRPINLGNYSVRIIDTNDCEGDMSAQQFYNSIGTEENLVDQIALYPNPTQGRVTLELNQLEVARLRVMDATGRTVVYREGCTGVCELNLSQAGAGLYQIIMITTDGKQVIRPIVVSK